MVTVATKPTHERRPDQGSGRVGRAGALGTPVDAMVRDVAP